MNSKIVKGRLLILFLVAIITAGNTAVPSIEPPFFSKNILTVTNRVFTKYTQGFNTTTINSVGQVYGFNAFVKGSMATIDFSDISAYIGRDILNLTGPINCSPQIEICDNDRDDDGDGQIDSDDADCVCPTIATTDPIAINVCTGEVVTFTIMTDVSKVPFHKIEFYRFTNPQSNPYTSSAPKIQVGAFNNDTGMGSVSSKDFPAINYFSATYYVYAVFDNAPNYLTDCAPFLEYVVNVTTCSGL